MNSGLPAPFDIRLMNVVATVLLLVFGALLLGVALRGLANHRVFAIERVTVSGDITHNNAATLRANVAHRIDGNFFTVDLQAVRQAFQSVPWIQSASVRREFPNRLDVVLAEHDPVAFWGPDTGSALIDVRGQVFEANVDDLDPDDLMPRLDGPQDSSAEVLAMYRALQPVFSPLEMRMDELTLSRRGGWRALMDTGAAIELGSGTAAEVEARVERFVRTLTQVTSQYGRRAQALESADLRHTDGYAIRLRGVTTTTVDAPAAKKKSG